MRPALCVSRIAGSVDELFYLTIILFLACLSCRELKLPEGCEDCSTLEVRETFHESI